MTYKNFISIISNADYIFAILDDMVVGLFPIRIHYRNIVANENENEIN